MIETNILEQNFNKAYESYANLIKMRACYKITNKEVCKDLVQDTFMKTWMYLVKGGNIENMKAFLYHVLNNLVIDEYRKRKNISLDELLEQGFEIGTETRTRDIDQLDGTKALELIQKLPEKYRHVLGMRFVDDLSISEIAQKTGKSPNLAAVTIHRGLNQLKKLSHMDSVAA